MAIRIDKGTTAMRSCSEGKRLGSILNITWASKNLQPRSRVGGSVNGKLVRGNIRGKGVVRESLAKLT